MKGEVARAGTRLCGSEAVWRERGLRHVERVDEYLVDAEIAAHREAAVGHRIDRVAMRLLLPLLVDALAFVLDEAAWRARHDGPQAAVGP